MCSESTAVTAAAAVAAQPYTVQIHCASAAAAAAVLLTVRVHSVSRTSAADAAVVLMLALMPV
jgi:hypothetical protein